MLYYSMFNKEKENFFITIGKRRADMGGIFGVISKRNCALELFYGVDYPERGINPCDFVKLI